MEYREIQDNGKNVYVSLNRDEIHTEFDTGVTQAVIYYHDSSPTDNNALYSLRVDLSKEFIDDTYHLTGRTSEKAKIKACLDVGVRAYEEKYSPLQNIETVRGVSANSRLRYIPRIDMQSTAS